MRRALISVLRAARLIQVADSVMAQRAAWRLSARNTAYRRRHAQRPFPNPAHVFEVAGHADLESFDASGAAHAAAVTTAILQDDTHQRARVLEWGCSPARIMTHLARLLPEVELHGCDRDTRAVRFARDAVRGARTTRCGALPPLPYPDQHFDAVYGVSVLTHLPERTAQIWIAEIARILKPEGAALLTTHGAAAAAQLKNPMRERFSAGRYVTLGGAVAGSRTFVSYLNEDAGRNLFARSFDDITLLSTTSSALGQDAWLLRQPRHALTATPRART